MTIHKGIEKAQRDVEIQKAKLEVFDQIANTLGLDPDDPQAVGERVQSNREALVSCAHWMRLIQRHIDKRRTLEVDRDNWPIKLVEAAERAAFANSRQG